MSVQNVYYAAPNGLTYIDPNAVATYSIQLVDNLIPTGPYNYILQGYTDNNLYVSAAEFTTQTEAFNALAAIVEQAIAANTDVVTSPVLVQLT